ncbi:nuclear transport factor 2 family protein [Chitinophaga varians]|uniref:nuclear transport factor 2 family protein n=1 Tax=Chitinophaga varians TaxID=2202339 RepID=UPI00165F8C76|nr:nuclear transport factor 2 family protein [Chitinophaga varians]MBC9909082.1 nuclear transport factor 2 family protein [Chitinophaga varians]
MDNLSKAKEEVIRFHEQIAAWFRGDEPVAAGGIKGLLANFSPDFRIVSPEGNRSSLEELAAMIRELLGKLPDMRIAVKDIQGYATDYHVLLTYTEVQADSGGENSRYSSAVFIRDGDRMLWLDLWERF